MKSFFRLTNAVLLIVALAAAGFFGVMYYKTSHFPETAYEEKVAAIKAQTEQTRRDTVAAKKETAARLDALRADLRNVGEEGAAIADRFEQMKAESEEKTQRLAELEALIARDEDMPASVEAVRHEYGLKIRELEEKIQSGQSSVRICYWTLDDGPSYITGNFLDALDAMDHVHVTFFAANMANDAPDEEAMLRREVSSGHSVQNHSYSHAYWAGGELYKSLDVFIEQVRLQDEWIYTCTGVRPGVFRFPGGAAWGRDLVPGAVEALDEMGYEWVDWNCNLYDSGAADKLPSAALEVTRAMTQISDKQIAMILGHDWNMNTLAAMREAIPQLQAKGYVFLPLFQESLALREAMKAV